MKKLLSVLFLMSFMSIALIALSRWWFLVAIIGMVLFGGLAMSGSKTNRK